MIEILETDLIFSDSPDAGDPDCICSRCKKQIPEEDAPIIRMWPDDGDIEFRFCRECSDKAGVHFALASKTPKP